MMLITSDKNKYGYQYNWDFMYILNKNFSLFCIANWDRILLKVALKCLMSEIKLPNTLMKLILDRNEWNLVAWLKLIKFFLYYSYNADHI